MKRSGLMLLLAANLYSELINKAYNYHARTAL